MRRSLFCWVVAAIVCQAAGKVAPINKDGKGVALMGYDAVAYFTESKPVRGSEMFTHTWEGSLWRFASSENRDRFAAEPTRYAPQFGGYCAWAVSNNYTAPIDPAAWKIVDGKLYLNYNKSVQSNWEKNIPANVAKGDANWPNKVKAP